MYSYELHGYAIECAWPLPMSSSRALSKKADLFITHSNIQIKEPQLMHPLRSSEGHEVAWLGCCDLGFILNFQNQAQFLFSESILSVLNTSLSESDLDTLLLSQVIPMAFSFTADLMLHSSGVEKLGQAWAFLGLEGAGKSTLAASFFERDFKVLSDDSLRVDISFDSIKVYPGTPEIRMFSESIGKIFKNPEALNFSEAIHKMRLKLPHQQLQALPLAGIFCLNPQSEDTEVSINSLQPMAALPFLLRSLFRWDLQSQSSMTREISGAVQLLSRTPAYEVKYSHKWESRENLVYKISEVMLL